MHRRTTAAIFVVVLALALAACAPGMTPSALSGTRSASPAAGAPATTGPSGGATAAVTAPATTPSAAGSSAAGNRGTVFAGVVKHAGKPVPGARVELREVGWAASQTASLATVQAGAQGTFSLVNPPVGDFSVIGVFPGGEMDAGGWPPVHIAPGQVITGFVVPLERRLMLLSPIAGAPAVAAPSLNWKPSDEATRYHVWVIDAGTTRLLLDQTTTGTTLTVPKGLNPGLYQWVVNGLDAAGEIVATGEETFVVGGGAGPTPAAPASSATASPGTPEVSGLRPGAMPRLPDRDRAFEAAREALARQLGIDPLSVQRVEVTATDFMNGCLGLAKPGERCTQAITPGWIVVLDANAQRYEAHTGQGGKPVRLAGLQ